MRSSRFFVGLVTCLVLGVSSLLADLKSDIGLILNDRVMARVETGIEVVRLSDNGTSSIVYEHNSHAPLSPASNMKVMTTSAALHVLGPTFRYRTMLLKHGNDLVIWGDGDPTLGDRELMEKLGWSVTAVFDDWADQLKKRNITTVGNILIDDSLFDTEFLHPRWAKHQFERSGAQVGALNFNANVIDFVIQARRGAPAAWSTKPQTSFVQVVANTCVSGGDNVIVLARNPGQNEIALRGTVNGTCEVATTIHDPPMYAGTVFADILKAKGIVVAGQVVRDRTTRQQYSATATAARAQLWPILCIFETPLQSVINRCNKDSMNLYAEALCKRIGAAASTVGGTWPGGTAVTGHFLKQLGVAETEFNLDDGCGLSRENTITADAIVRVLMHDYFSPYKDIFIGSLPIGGVDGTLRRRFTGSLKGRVFAKTGFIANVSALSGYLQARNGDWYAFAILMNNIPDKSNSNYKPLQEKMVKAIDDNLPGAKPE